MAKKILSRGGQGRLGDPPPWRPDLFLLSESMADGQDKMITKRIGRPATGQGQLIGVRLHPGDLAALDRFANASDQPMTRPQAIRVALSDWLRTHGYVEVDHPAPVGPATEVVEAMEAAIKQHRRSSSSE